MKPALITDGQITARLGIIAAGQIAAEHGMITAEQGVVAVWYLDGRNLRDGTSAVRVGPGFAGTGNSVRAAVGEQDPAPGQLVHRLSWRQPGR